MAASSQLPNDLLSIIGHKLDLAADRVSFRSVSKSWRSNIPFPQFPLLLLAESGSEHETTNNNSEDEGGGEVNVNPPLPPRRGFVGLGEQDIYEFDLPEAHQRRCVGSSGNWLITVGLDTTIRVLNPLSRVELDLPPHTKFNYSNLGSGKPVSGSGSDSDSDSDITPEIYRDTMVHKAIIFPTPFLSSTNRNCIAVAIHHYLRKLAICRPGDSSWVTVQPSMNFFQDVVFFKGQFYAVTHHGLVATINIDEDLQSPTASVVMPRFELDKLGESRQKKYLVELMGELLLVIKYMFDSRWGGEEKDCTFLYHTKEFKIYKLDFINEKWDALNSLGEYSLFLGENYSVSVLASGYCGRVKRNCIYFTDDYFHGYRGSGTAGGHDMGVFDMDNKSVQPHFNGISTSLYSPPIWLIPTPQAKTTSEAS